MSAASWLESLPLPPGTPACEGMPSWYWDATAERDATKALSICARCPVTDWCADVVRPSSSFFDGVAAGRVYRNGKDVGGLDLAVPA